MTSVCISCKTNFCHNHSHQICLDCYNKINLCANLYGSGKKWFLDLIKLSKLNNKIGEIARQTLEEIWDKNGILRRKLNIQKFDDKDKKFNFINVKKEFDKLIEKYQEEGIKEAIFFFNSPANS